MSNKQIWFILDKSNFTHNNTKTLDVLHIKIDNSEINSAIIQDTINKFNEEIEWGDMWNLNSAITRLNNNHDLFIFLKNRKPMGHVWYNQNYLYNAFVSKTRENGESVEFLAYTITEKFNSGFDKIVLYTDDWNIRAIKFWEKLGFKKIK